jgi:hypothetical protein
MSWIDVVADDFHDIVAEEWTKLTDHHMSISFEIALNCSWNSIDPSTGNPISSRKYAIAAASVQRIGEDTFVTGAITDISRQKWMESLQALRGQEALELKRQQENFMDVSSTTAIMRNRNPLKTNPPD